MLGLLPHMTERRSGHIVNVSSIGVQTNPPRFSAYVASKSALDAFTRVVSSETIGDNVTFTTIHMPLVRTPMIAPTKMYDSFPTISPDEAADLICEAIRAKPKQINTRLGTFGEVAYALAPKAVDQILHMAYKVFPESAAASGKKDSSERASGEATGARVPDARRALVTDDHVTVTGTAERAVAPGAATWRAEAVEADDDPRAAFERCSSRLNLLVERLEGLGEVATEAVVVQPRWEERGPAGAEAIGAVRVRAAAARAGDVAQAAMAAGADRLHGPRFEYDDAAGVRRELLGEAVADARGKAERLAAAGGRKLGPVRQIQESGPERTPGHFRAAAETVVESPDVRPRELTVTATVTVTFALTD